MEAAKRLEKSGAEGIVIACNTVHKCYDAVAGHVRVPVLHIGDARPSGWSPTAAPAWRCSGRASP